MITLTTEQAQQIEEALEDIVRVFEFETGTPVEALAAIREALAEQEKQEPVAVISESAIGLVKLHSNGACLPFGTQLYAAPVSVEAAVLSEREACAKVCEAKQSYNAMHANTEFAAAIRARSEK